MIPVKALVFDLDGTLVDSLQDIAESVNAVLVRHGRSPHSLNAYRTLVGWGLKSLVASASAEQPFDDAEAAVVFAEIVEEYRKHPVHSTLYTGISELLAWAVGKIPLGVFSNKEHAMTLQVIQSLVPSDPFHTIVGARAGVPHKPDPTGLLEILKEWKVAPEATVFLGDSNVDMETANRAGAIACGAAWGFRDKKELQDHGAMFVFDTPDSFRKWLETQTVLG